MFALLSLIGIALAGSAIIGVQSPMDDDAVAPDEAFETDETLMEQVVMPDFFKSMDQDVPTFEGTDTGDAENALAPLPFGKGLGPDLSFTDMDDDVADDVTDIMVDATGDIVDVGGAEDGVLSGHAGDDFLDGGAGNDTLTGGAGDDQMHGGEGNDQMSGNDGDDLIFGHIGDDVLFGGVGDDDVHGGEGADVVEGGVGDDILSGGYGDDTLIGGAGRDNIQGSEGDDIIDGVTGEDSAERDYLNGSEGNDTLIGNNGDVMSGGTGADRFEVVDGAVTIMDYEDDDVLVLNYDGTAPVLTTETTTNGTTLLADGTPVASLYGITAFDVSTVYLVAA